MPVRPVKDLLITAAETNSHHGVGILLQRLFPQSEDFICLRSTTLYHGNEPFGSAHYELRSRTLTRARTLELLGDILGKYEIRRILCVPYYREEFTHGVLARQLTGAPLCTYLMDDQNVLAPHVPDHRVAELLAASDLVLGISPELCAAYECKYGRAVELLPPVVTGPISPVPCYWQPESGERLRAAMIGNLWTGRRLEQLRLLLRSTGLEMDWYGKGPEASWLQGSHDEWEKDGLYCAGYLPEEDLVAALASYPFLVVPSGTLDADDDNVAFSRLSLPSRLVFLQTSTDTPVLVFGSPDTAAGRFVSRLQTGVCAATPEEFKAQVARLLRPDFRRQLQANARRVGPALTLPEAGEWIWRSLARGRAEPGPFNAVFPAAAAKPDVTNWGITAPRPLLPAIALPAEGPLSDKQVTSLAFLRRSHLAWAAGNGAQAIDPEEELSVVSAGMLRHVLPRMLPAGGEVLFIGDYHFDRLEYIPASIRLWRFTSVADWQRAGYAGDPALIVSAFSGELHPAIFPQFAAIVSAGWIGQLPNDRHALEGLSLYLDACTAPHGFNLHFHSAVLHSTFFWTPAAYEYLRNRFLAAAAWPDLDALLESDDVFVMGRKAYDRDWKAFAQKPYDDFGSPISLGLFWRKSGG